MYVFCRLRFCISELYQATLRQTDQLIKTRFTHLLQKNDSDHLQKLLESWPPIVGDLKTLRSSELELLAMLLLLGRRQDDGIFVLADLLKTWMNAGDLKLEDVAPILDYSLQPKWTMRSEVNHSNISILKKKK